jgi:hypothetical protein
LRFGLLGVIGLAVLCACSSDVVVEDGGNAPDDGGNAPGGNSSTGGSDVGGAPVDVCANLRDGDAAGRYLFTLSLTLNPKLAFAFDTTLVLESGGGQTLVGLTMQPLSAADQTSPVGVALAFGGLPIEDDGTFDWELGELTIPGPANPISGIDITAELQLSGGLCDDGPGFFCGDVTGASSAPFELDLEGSTFTFQKHEGSIPFPLINCNKDPAVY